MLSILYLILAMLFGFSVPQPPVQPEPMVVDEGVTEVRVQAGVTARLPLGDGNDSIGHGYAVVDAGDPAVVSVTPYDGPTEQGCKPGGCDYEKYLDVTGIAPGATEVVTQYCFRSDLDNCDTAGESPVTWRITVF